MVEMWKVPLQKKAEKRARKEANPPTIVPDEVDSPGIMYVHDPDQGIELPVHPDQIFAVMMVKGTQYKVARDDRVVLESLGEEFQVGDQLVFDQILLVGSADYTQIGKPLVSNARVHATLEEVSRSEKVIIFKKRRRKGYQKSAGHKQTLNVIKINKIEHIIDENSAAQNIVKPIERLNHQRNIRMF